MTAPRYLLDPALPVLLRPDGSVQVGWRPARALIVRPPQGCSTRALAELLRRLQSGASAADLATVLAGPDLVETILSGLRDAGVVGELPALPRRTPAIRIHGRGPLSDLLRSGLSCSGARVTHTSRRHAVLDSDGADLVVLTDQLVADPGVVRDLHAANVPHLQVRVRDGTGLVGPLVIPGHTSCLSCADLHRSDRDAAWPALAAQLRDTVGSADRATVLATAALALSQVDRVIRAVRQHDGPGPVPPAPPTLDTTLEFDVAANSIMARRWTRHPLCGC